MKIEINKAFWTIVKKENSSQALLIKTIRTEILQ